MKPFKLRTMAMVGALSIAGLGLIGTGVHAVFMSDATATQTITAGTLAVALSSSGAASSMCLTAAGDCQSLTFSPLGLVGSTYTTGDQTVTVTNAGSLPVYETSFTLTATGTSNLVTESSVCITRPWQGGQRVFYNGPLPGISGVFVPIAGWPVIAGAATDTYTVNVYAGTDPTACGGIYSGLAGQGDSPTYVNGGSAHIWDTPSGTTSVAPTLGNDSEGGNMTVTVKMTYGESD
jgi:predicted ribosomally synthesized peptide with SipW-like signal peptide